MAGVHQYPNPADHPDAQPFLRHLAESRGDPLARMEFADWLQEQGYDNAAHTQRWAAKHGKRPADAKYSEGAGTEILGGWSIGDIAKTGTGLGSTEYPYAEDAGFAHFTLPTHFFRAGTKPNESALSSPMYSVNTHDGNMDAERELLKAGHQLEWGDDGHPVWKWNK